MSEYKKVGGDNQKTIIVKKSLCDKEHIYATINIEARKLARKTLNGNEYKLWEYIAENQTGYQFDLSSAAFMNDSNVSRPTYSKAVNKLIDLGYLVLKNKSTNTYIFYDMPHEEEVIDAEHYNIEYSEEQIARIKYLKELEEKTGFHF